MPSFQLLTATGLIALSAYSYAGEVDVVNATVKALGDNRYHFSATLQHADTGWDHYANAWQVLGLDGTVYGTRTLYHPHVNEQPFTRSLSNVSIPAQVKTVKIKAFDSVHGVGGKEFTLQLP